MAENVKRRVAAARLAVAFVAAGTIAGAGAWAQAGPTVPSEQDSAVAQDSAVDSFLKLRTKLHKVEVRQRRFQKVVRRRYFPKVLTRKRFATKSQLGDYLKVLQADARYLKAVDADARYLKNEDIPSRVVQGKGSVDTTALLLPAVQKVRMAEVPGRFTVDANQEAMTIMNTSQGPLMHSSCSDPASGDHSGTLKPGEQIDCLSGDAAQTLQLITSDGSVATLHWSAIPTNGGTQGTVQILIGL